MKLSILPVLILIVNISFSQEKNNALHDKIFKTNIEENHYLVNNPPLDFLNKIEVIEFLEPTNNSEGKFPVYKAAKNSAIGKETRNEVIKSIYQQGYANLINDLIIKKMLSDNNLYLTLENDAQFYGDRGIELYKNLNEYRSLLSRSFEVNSKIKIQTGKDLTPYLTKIYKSEIDNILLNSINLLAINF